MNFNEAKKALRGVEHFFRALKVVTEALDEAEKAIIATNQAKEEEISTRASIARMMSETAAVRADLDNMKATRAQMLIEAEAKAEAKYGTVAVKIQQQIGELENQLAELQAKTAAAAVAHSALMDEFKAAEIEAAQQVKDWQNKLAAAEKAYAAFKAKIA